MRRHEDPGHGAVAAGLPRALGARDAAVRVELRGRLAEVPDVPGPVLRVPVGRPLREPAGEVEAVVDDGARDALDPLRPVRDRDDVARRLPVLDAAVDVDRPRREREPRVVDAGANCERGGHAAAGGRRERERGGHDDRDPAAAFIGAVSTRPRPPPAARSLSWIRKAAPTTPRVDAACTIRLTANTCSCRTYVPCDRRSRHPGLRSARSAAAAAGARDGAGGARAAAGNGAAGRVGHGRGRGEGRAAGDAAGRGARDCARSSCWSSRTRPRSSSRGRRSCAGSRTRGSRSSRSRPGTVYFETHGVERLYGGLEPALKRALASVGAVWDARAGAAERRFAALAAANVARAGAGADRLRRPRAAVPLAAAADAAPARARPLRGAGGARDSHDRTACRVAGRRRCRTIGAGRPARLEPGERGAGRAGRASQGRPSRWSRRWSSRKQSATS